MPENVYIHIPFCESKCKYCSFVSTTQTDLIEKYAEALEKEFGYFYKSETLKTLYFGGGTPSLLEIKYVKKFIDFFDITDQTEITFEINPDDADINYLKGLKDAGINRLSFGVQTFNDEILNAIGRRHNSIEVFKAIENANKTEFKNVSIDLIYGLPNQTIELLQKDLKIIKDIDIQHVSTYGLKIEKPSYFFSHPVTVPDDDTQADMYLMINDFLEDIDFKRYEISNFAKSGYESKHNLNYWNNAEYYGFGAAAHGYNNGIRYSNTPDIEKYIKNPTVHKTEHSVTAKENLEEEIFLGFRREYGINIEKINKNFGIDFESKYNKILAKYIPKYIIKTDFGYKFTLDGVLLSNNILADFLD